MRGFSMDVVRLYAKFILKVKPSPIWQGIRFGLHWLTLPLKLLLIGGLGYYQIFTHRNDKRRIPNKKKLPYPEEVLAYLPVWQTAGFKCYVNRQYADQDVNGQNHNPDHQCSRHSTFAFILSKLKLRDQKVDNAVGMHMTGERLARGFNVDAAGVPVYNDGTVSGDMLCGLNLAILTAEDGSILFDKFEALVQGIIDNDYSLLEGKSPDPEDPGYDLWQELLKEVKLPEFVRMKSARGMWQPGLETVGAQALTILSALKLCYAKTKSPAAKKAYDDLFMKYGYGILSLFPTAYIKSKRGYFNDHNCMIALYVLSKLADTPFEKWLYKTAMKYVWRLSKHWYNGYFTGLLLDAYPELRKEKEFADHLVACLEYLSEVELPEAMIRPDSFVRKDCEVPARISLMAEDEFYPDIQFDREIDHVDINCGYYRTGLGYFASLVMCLRARDYWKHPSE